MKRVKLKTVPGSGIVVYTVKDCKRTSSGEAYLFDGNKISFGWNAQGEVVQGVQLWAEVPFILILLDKMSIVPASKPSSESHRLKATTSTAASSTCFFFWIGRQPLN